MYSEHRMEGKGMEVGIPVYVWYMVCGVCVCFESWDKGVWVSSSEKADLI